VLQSYGGEDFDREVFTFSGKSPSRKKSIGVRWATRASWKLSPGNAGKKKPLLEDFHPKGALEVPLPN